MNHALRVLEYHRVIERLLAHCETPFGAELCAALKPVFDAKTVWLKLAETDEGHRLLASDPPPSLAPLHDPRPFFHRAHKKGTLDGVEIFRCGAALGTMRQLRDYLKTKEGYALALFADALPEAQRLEEKLLSSVDSGGEVLDEASSALASLRARRAGAAARVVERIQSYVSGRTRDWLSDPLYTVRDGRYVLPLKAENRGKIKGIVHDTSSTGATIFVEPDDVLQLGNALREIEAAERAEVQRILKDLSERIAIVAEEAMGGVEAASAVDAIFARARLAYAQRATMPQPVEGCFIALQAARHPLLDTSTVVPLDLAVGQGSSVLITGPNTGGKTVAIKTVGLAVAMAQSGLFPVALDIKLGPFTRLFADIGDEQSLQQSLSTFSGHIKNIAEALKLMSPGALILFDEIGAGTDPAEGSALAIAILRRMASAGCAILASTHYGELKAFAYESEGFTNAAMEFDPKTLRPTYRVLMGAAGASQALRIAERYGIPADLVQEAREGLGQVTLNLSSMMEELDRAQRLARTAQGDADRRLTELRRLQEETSKQLADAEEQRKMVRRRGATAIEDALREIRLEASRIFEELKKNPTPVGFEKARRTLKDLNEVGQSFADDVAPRRTPISPKVTASLTKGMQVRIEGFPQVGLLLDLPDGKLATVQLGAMKMSVPITKVAPAKDAPAEKAKPKANLGFARAQTASTEIHLRHMRAEQAQEDLEKFLDDAVLAGLPSVRIVHGKGEGVLRKLTQDLLRRHSDVKTYRDGEPGEGGHGVTVAIFK